MGACQESRQVFRYVFRPLGEQKQDGGFSVHLFDDGRFYFRAYDAAGFMINEEVFRVSLDIIDAFYRLIADNKTWLVCKRPLLVGKTKHVAAHIVEVAGYDPIYVVDLESLVSSSKSDSVGYFAGRVHTMFERASNLLLWCDLCLFLDHFSSIVRKPLSPYVGSGGFDGE